MTNINRAYSGSEDLFAGGASIPGVSQHIGAVGLSASDAVIIGGIPSMLANMSLAEVGMLHVLSKCPGISEDGALWYAVKNGLTDVEFSRVWAVHTASAALTVQPRGSRKSKPKLPQIGVGPEVVIRLPLKDGQTVAVMDDFVVSMIEAYVGVDVQHELVKAQRWLEVNPAKRKTLQGMGRFINTWMRNCHERIQLQQQMNFAEREKSTPFGLRSSAPTPDSSAPASGQANSHLDALMF